MAAESAEPQIHRGLDGVLADVSGISNVVPNEKKLLYRGYPVAALAEQCSFEEVAYLLLFGELPTAADLAPFRAQEAGLRQLDPIIIDQIRRFPSGHHLMDGLRTGVSLLGMSDEFPKGSEPADDLRRSITLLSKIPTIIATDARLRAGLDPIDPDPNLSIAENYLWMSSGTIPAPELVRAFDASLTLYAEHSFNASTFTARVVTSTLSDLCSSVVAAIGALKGPLHGGANEAVMQMLIEIDQPEKARQWVLDALAAKRKIMGFGHRLYRLGDSRVPTMKRYRDAVAEVVGDTRWMQISKIVEETVEQEKGIPPNLDFPAGPMYHLLGLEIQTFTPIFVMARVTGWAAHIMEQRAANRLIRPSCVYNGPEERTLLPIDRRV